MKYPKQEKATSLKRQTQLKLEGPFECQPEYRRAYIDYLIREKLDKGELPLDNFGRRRRRIFEDEDKKVTFQIKPENGIA